MCVYNSVVTAPWFSCQTSSVLFFFFSTQLLHVPTGRHGCGGWVAVGQQVWFPQPAEYHGGKIELPSCHVLISPLWLHTLIFFPPPFCSVFPRGFSLANCFSNSFRSFPHASYLIATWVQVWHNTITITQVNEKPPKNKTQLRIIFQAWAIVTGDLKVLNSKRSPTQKKLLCPKGMSHFVFYFF